MMKYIYNNILIIFSLNIGLKCHSAFQWVRSVKMNQEPSPTSINGSYFLVCKESITGLPLQWRHNDYDSVSNHQPHGCLLNRLFRHRSKKHQNSASLAFVWGIHRDQWIPRTKGQLRGKCFYLMTSSWMIYVARVIGPLVKARRRSYASVNKVITGSDDGLPPVRCQAITRKVLT